MIDKRWMMSALTCVSSLCRSRWARRSTQASAADEQILCARSTSSAAPACVGLGCRLMKRLYNRILMQWYHAMPTTWCGRGVAPADMSTSRCFGIIRRHSSRLLPIASERVTTSRSALSRAENSSSHLSQMGGPVISRSRMSSTIMARRHVQTKKLMTCPRRGGTCLTLRGNGALLAVCGGHGSNSSASSVLGIGVDERR